jgi:hypothetical protein
LSARFGLWPRFQLVVSDWHGKLGNPLSSSSGSCLR